MEVILNKNIKNPIIIEGFPGIGLVGSIATEFLIEHLNAKEIGYIRGRGVPPMIAVHGGKIARPMGIYYSEQKNLLIFHFISGAPGKEWELAELIIDIANKTKAKEVISLESVGVPGPVGSSSNNYFYSDFKGADKKLEKLGAKRLENGIVMGVTSVLMASPKLPLTCIFGETHSKLPDSKAAAGVLEALNGYLGLKIDIKPLLKSAEEFEKKLKTLIESSNKVQKTNVDNTLSYLG